MQIHELQNSTSVFASDDFVMVSGQTNNTRKMSKDALLEQTATNTLKNNVAPEFDSTVAYAKGQFVTYQGKIYQFTSDHSAGAWNASHATVSGQSALLKMTAQNALAGNVAPLFDPNKPNDAGGYAYYAGNNVTYDGQNFVFIANHKAGAWNPLEVEHKPLSESINLQGVGEAVQTWLDAHPEATTTVEDSSLTESKFSDALKLQTIKDYVTPEMFGAKGDGVTDDTAAFEEALSAHSTVVGKSGHTYAIQGIYVDNKQLYNCLFKPVAGYTEDGITIHGRTHLFNCRVQSFRYNLVFASGTIYAEVDFCRFSDAKICNVYIDRVNGWANSNVIRNCHIMGAGRYTTDDSSPEYGCGIYIDGSVLGLFIQNNCLEVNKKYGIKYRVSTTTVISGMSVVNNYFEAHKEGDIYLVMATSSGRLSRTLITGNAFTSVSGYRSGIVIPGAFVSCYSIEDANGVLIASVRQGSGFMKTFNGHRPHMTAGSFASTRTISVSAYTRPEVPYPTGYKVLYNAQLASEFTFKQDTTIINIPTGFGEFFIKNGNGTFNRDLVNDEFFDIVQVTAI